MCSCFFILRTRCRQLALWPQNRFGQPCNVAPLLSFVQSLGTGILTPTLTPRLCSLIFRSMRSIPYHKPVQSKDTRNRAGFPNFKPLPYKVVHHAPLEPTPANVALRQTLKQDSSHVSHFPHLSPSLSLSLSIYIYRCTYMYIYIDAHRWHSGNPPNHDSVTKGHLCGLH